MLNLYLCGLERVCQGEGTNCTEAAREYQHEAAWRMTVWGDHTQYRHAPFSAAGSVGGYHQSVYNCITALRDGELSAVESSLAEARYIRTCMNTNAAALAIECLHLV